LDFFVKNLFKNRREAVLFPLGHFASNLVTRFGVFDVFEEELIGVQVYPVGQFTGIRVQVNPDGQTTEAEVGRGAKTAIVITKVGRIEKIKYFLMICFR
jgi:hypothetical protein